MIEVGQKYQYGQYEVIVKYVGEDNVFVQVVGGGEMAIGKDQIKRCETIEPCKLSLLKKSIEARINEIKRYSLNYMDSARVDELKFVLVILEEMMEIKQCQTTR